MEANTKSKLHPLTAIAAVSVTLFSLVGVGAITGLIPTSHSQNTQSQAAVTTAEPAKTLAAAEPATTTTVTTTTMSEAKPVAKPVVHNAAVKHVKPAEKLASADQLPANPSYPYPPAPVAQNYPPPNMAPPPNAAPPKPICRDCGVIESVREVEKTGQPTGSGAAIGGIAGGVLGNQAGRGNGRTVMTVLGAIGGAVAGHEIEKNTHKVKSYEINVRFDDGTTRLITQDTPPVWRSGDRVRVQDGAITASNAY